MSTIWSPDLAAHAGPKYRALVEALRTDVRAGRLAPGTRLPPVRDLAGRLGVTPGTVARAYQLATESGLLDAQVGRGTFVRQPGAEPPAPRPLLLHEDSRGLADLLVSRAVEVGQSGEIGEIFAQAARSGLDFTRYPAEDTDLMPCRAAVADWLADRGIAVAPRDLVLTEGAQQGLFAALELALPERDPAVGMDELTYPGFRRAVRALRGRAIHLPADGEGILPGAVEEAVHRHGLRALVLSPDAHNPTAVRMGPARREALAALARQHDLAIVQDDVYALVQADRAAGFERLCPERAWIAASFSKCVAAGIRLGFLACPPGRGAGAPRILRGIGQQTSLLVAAAAERLIRSGAADRIRAAVRAETLARVDAARAILAGRELAGRPDLNFLWVPLPPPWRVTAFVAAAERAGVLVAGADVFAAPDRPAPNAVRLALSGPPDRAALARSVGTLAALLAGPAPDLAA